MATQAPTKPGTTTTSNAPQAKPMQPTVHAYLNFGGRCEEALEFYAKHLNGKVQTKMRFSESPEKTPEGMLPKGFEHKIMHSEIMIGSSMVMATDGCGGEEAFSGFSLAHSVLSEAEADRVFAALSNGGKVTMPLAKTFWSPKFGMCQDKFGVGWMVMVCA